MLQRNSEDVATYGLLVLLVVGGLAGLSSAVRSLQHIGVAPAVGNAVAGLLLLAAAGGVTLLARR